MPAGIPRKFKVGTKVTFEITDILGRTSAIKGIICKYGPTLPSGMYTYFIKTIIYGQVYRGIDENKITLVDLKEEIVAKIKEIHSRQPFFIKYKRQLPTWRQYV